MTTVSEWIEKSPYSEALGIVAESVEESRIALALPFRETNSNPGGALHGGVAASLSVVGAQAVARGALGAGSGPWHTVAFQINYLAEGTYSLSMTARDYSPGSQDGIEISSRASTHQVRIALERGSGFRARVVDSSGQPVRGAMALVRDTTGNMIPMQPANSDNGGQLVVRGLAQGTYQVSVLHRAFATGRFTVKVDGKDREQTFQLQDGGAARLQVVDVRRNGIAGATIQLTDSRGNNPLQDGEIFSLGAQGRGPAIVTDGQGFVSVDRIPPGSYRVTATRNGKSSRPESVRIRAGEVAEAQLTIR